MKKKVLSLVLSAAMLTTFAAGCKKSDSASEGKKEIYFLNFKPEIESVYKEIAETYEKETGVKVKVVTAASGTYETTLKSEMNKSEAPTIFQINGPVGYQSWKEYTADLKDSELYKSLIDKDMAVTDGDGVYGIPYVVEGYGIIYNNAIMEKYFALSDKAVSISSAEEIKNFDTLKKVVEDMSKHKDDLGIKGVFASTSLGAGEQWRWQTHLANLPLYYEFKDKAGKEGDLVLAGLDSKEIEFKYGENYKNIFDLYINNSVTDSKLLGSKTVADSMAEFALGEVAMVQNGNWAWSQISGVDGNVVKESDIKFLPIYTGVSGEENQGISIGTENFFAINKKVSEEKQKESIKFLEWLYSSEKGKEYVTKKLGFIAPFNTFKDNEKPTDPLAKEVLRYMENDKLENVTWTFTAFPSEDFKNYFGDALLQYAQGKKTWDDVKKVVTEQWASEKAK
ncbi:MAG: carbohydrate ABC transporter substrate-binding protein [Clostridiales bacterium]|uniref:ABC transporter substrate-binding protein n=1 Tax=Clostridium sp. N3C TaxID=1776758 RepID=UPI00092DF202|nr:ABC transporter substrate-binding protein [Clostridium sp. N3C]NLZ50005.1 carbohydrate ABC transporter substrate-binding protein [Clostridiales bacterium]SCN25885.1 maltose ABC transporter periplasmic protein [Clostridium sp. N3C]